LFAVKSARLPLYKPLPLQDKADRPFRFVLAYDHPFVDGNGRVAGALFYWSALPHGYWLLEFVSISRVLKQAPAQHSPDRLSGTCGARALGQAKNRALVRLPCARIAPRQIGQRRALLR